MLVSTFSRLPYALLWKVVSLRIAATKHPEIYQRMMCEAWIR